MWREKLLGQEFDNLGQLAQQMVALNSQFQNMHKDTRFQKSAAIAKAYNLYSVDDGEKDDEEEEIAMAEWNWGKKTVTVQNPWGKGLKRAMISTSQNQISSLISCLREDRSNCPPIILCYLLIS